MHAWQNRIIFGLAKELNIDIETLRDMAADINKGKRSLSKLKPGQAGELIYSLNNVAGRNPHYKKEGVRLAAGHKEFRPDGKVWDYLQQNRKWSQIDLLFDYMIKIGWELWEMRAWLNKYFHIQHEGWLNRNDINKAIEGLKSMYKRGKTGEDVSHG